MKIDPIVYDGKSVGRVVNGVIYITPRVLEKHLFRGGRATVQEAIRAGLAAWGINADLLKILMESGVKIICVETKLTTYWAAALRIENEGYWLDMGHGLQRFLELSKWDRAQSVNHLIGAVNVVMFTKGEAA